MGKVRTQASALQERSVSEFGLWAEEHTQEPNCGQDLDCGFMHSTSFKQPSLKLTKTNCSLALRGRYHLLNVLWRFNDSHQLKGCGNRAGQVRAICLPKQMLREVIQFFQKYFICSHEELFKDLGSSFVAFLFIFFLLMRN